VFPNEGLDVILNIVPKGGSVLANTFVGLFTAAGATSVPAATVNLSQLAGAGNAAFAEVSTTLWATYLRMTTAAGSWGAQGGSTIWATVGRAVQGSQVQFPAPGAGYSPALPIAGFFLATTSAYGASSALYYSNFEDGSTIVGLSTGDIVKVSPGFGFGN